ncbi:hypothetical protein B0H13DRAFT_1866455 [Mycena leptocephala]|nr:hypothetical protein B0H13DRAFT_1866455 [Mycena leptocephala]
MSPSYAGFSPIQRCCFTLSIAVAPLEAVDYQTAASSHLVHVGLSAFRSTIGIRHDVSQGSGLDLDPLRLPEKPGLAFDTVRLGFYLAQGTDAEKQTCWVRAVGTTEVILNPYASDLPLAIPVQTSSAGAASPISGSKKESNKGKTFVSPLFLLLHRGKLNLFPSEKAKEKGEIFHGSGITSYTAVFPDEKVFDRRSSVHFKSYSTNDAAQGSRWHAPMRFP